MRRLAVSLPWCMPCHDQQPIQQRNRGKREREGKRGRARPRLAAALPPCLPCHAPPCLPSPSPLPPVLALPCLPLPALARRQLAALAHGRPCPTGRPPAPAARRSSTPLYPPSLNLRRRSRRDRLRPQFRAKSAKLFFVSRKSPAAGSAGDFCGSMRWIFVNYRGVLKIRDLGIKKDPRSGACFLGLVPDNAKRRRRTQRLFSG